jgi:ferritin-like metal-binding protein YciE
MHRPAVSLALPLQGGKKIPLLGSFAMPREFYVVSPAPVFARMRHRSCARLSSVHESALVLDTFAHMENRTMALDTLHDLMIHELKDLYSAERQLVQALPRMAKNATSNELQTAIRNHLAETEEHVARLQQLLEEFGESTRGQKCIGMEGLIEEAKELMDEDGDEDVLDAGIIAAAQRVEHYEIAAYGTVCEYARIMGHANAVELLGKTLEEEKKADELLTSLAEGGINALAQRDGQEGMGEEGEEEEEEPSTRQRAAKSTSKSTSKSGAGTRSKTQR